MLEKLRLRRDMSRNPLFDTIFVMQNTGGNLLEAEGIRFIPYESTFNLAKLDLTLNAVELDDRIGFTLEYCTRLFCKETMARLGQYYLNLLERIVANDRMSLAELDLITEADQRRLLYDFNATAADYPRNQTIHGLFEEQAERSPDGIAVVLGEQHLSYGELNARANQLARRLREKGVGRDAIVELVVERSLEMIVGILGILKAGGAYLPIDPDYPKDRIAYVLEDSHTGILLVLEETREKVDFQGEVMVLDDPAVYSGNSGNLMRINQPGDLAYIIYTSGTTGKPKGAMIEHKNVVRLMFNEKMRFDFNRNDIWTMFHSYSFDFSVWEMYGALLYGGKLILIPKMTAKDSGGYLKLLKEEKVTVLNQTPSAFYRLLEEETRQPDSLLRLRYIIFGGEALHPAKLQPYREKYPATQLINMYGITETTVHVTYKEITAAEIKTNISNIGVPIPTLSTYVMDKNLRLLPVGIPGELCVGGDGVARGYLNQPELTAQKFVANPYQPDERLYRSGDLVRRLANGELEYLGRIDHQVKIRGFRIELGEIETVLRQYPGIKDLVVLARSAGDAEGTKRLVAYVVLQEGARPADSSLRAFLREKLPDYMAPAFFIFVDEMPLTANGKINLRALPEPDSHRVSVSADYAPPETAAEKVLAEIWASVLGLERAGIRDNFFDSGGDSILAIKVVAQAKQRGINLSINQIFQYLTIHELAQQLTGLEAAAAAEERTRAFSLLSPEDSARLLGKREKGDGNHGN